jgi:hypothetical protein
VGPAAIAAVALAAVMAGLTSACTAAVVEPTAAPERGTVTTEAPSSASAPTTSSLTTTTTFAPLPQSMKGWELYSWPVDGEWHYTLAVGTNRGKTI